MKKERGKISMLKKILIIAFVISLLSNHMLILGEVANIALAAEVEWSSDFTSDVNSEDEVQQNQTDDSNSVQESTVDENTAVDSVPPDEDDELSENVVAEVDPQNVISDENNIEDDVNDVEDSEEVIQEELSEEEIKAIQSIKANTELQVNKIIKYDNENGKGTVADVTFKVKVDAKEYKVSALNVNANLPNLSGVLPTAYKVEECSDNIEFSQDENGMITLNIKEVINNNEEELRLVLVYSEEAFTGTELNMSGNVRAEIAGQEVLGDFSETKEAVENTDTLATYGLTTDASSKYKGYLYANTLTESRKDIPFTTIDVIEIKDANFIDEIIVENNIDKIVTDSKEIDLVNMVTYKSTSVSVEEFKSTLGENGYIEIYNQLGEKIGELNSESEVKNNRYIFYYDKDVDTVTFKLKNIEANSTLNIKNEKAIKGSDTFSSEQVKTFKAIKSETVNKIAKIVNDTEVVVQRIYAENNISLEETESKMTLKMNTDDFVTTETNDVSFEVTLKTNEEKYELFRNPTISIELPSAVQNVEIKSINLMYKNGLSLGAWEVVKNEQGLNVIQVSLEGTQTEYSPGTMIEGTTLLISASLDLNKITANGKSAVKLRYTNEAGTNTSYVLEGKDCVDLEVNYVSRSGILKESKIQNFNAESDVLVSYDDKAVVGSIKAEDVARIATVSTVIMNNYNEEIGNVEIIGKIPSIGNTKDGVDLNTTFNTTLAGPVSLNGLVGKVYYSNNENETKESDNWEEKVIDYTQVKSFKVVLENDNMKIGEKIELSYNINIPENVGYNASAYNLFTTYYDYKNQEIEDSSILGLESEIKAIELDDCQVVEETPELSVGTQVTRGGDILTEIDEVNEGQILRYNVVLSNKTNRAITNINIKGYAENSNSYYWYTFKDIDSTTYEEILQGTWKEDVTGEHVYETNTIESLAPGETTVFSYQVKVKHLDEISNPEVYGKVVISADGIEEKEYQTIKNQIKNADIELVTTISGYENAETEKLYLYTKNIYNFLTEVKNISDEDLENVKVNVIVPSSLELSSLEMSVYNSNVEYSEREVPNGKMVTFIIPKLAIGETKGLITSGVIESMDVSIVERTLTINANAELNGQLYKSNDYTRNVCQSETFLNIIYTSTPESGSIVKNGDNIKYNIVIQNTGVIDGIVDFTEFFDTGYKLNSAIVTYPDGTQKTLENTEYRYVMDTYILNPGQQITIEIDGTVDSSDFNTNQTKLENKFELFTSDLISQYEDSIFYIDPSQVITRPEDGITDEDSVEESEDSKNDFTNENQEYIEEIEQEDFVEETNEVEINTEELIQNTIQENNNESNNNESNNNETNNNENKIIEESSEENANNSQENIQQENEKQQDNDISENITSEVINTTNVDSVKYSISGKTWLDDNNNGLYDNEELLESIQVLLLKSGSLESSDINDSNIIKTTETNANGEYIFSNLDEGKYIVIFDYDDSLYEISSYQANGENDAKASDVIAKKLTLKSNEKTYAVSDIMEISSSNIDNVNMGLKENSDFDMAITTYIRNITTINEKGTETLEFEEDDRIAKIEIASKYLNTTSLTIEYIIKVTNNGKVDGYINQIANVIPDGMSFDTQSSNNWQLGEDGVLYSSSLNKVLIPAGETREINLILTKYMDNDSTGVYKNAVEILESTNNIKLSDSNKNNDKSEVELLITVKTGAIYYLFVVVIALLIAFIAMLIVSKLIKDDKNKVNFINKIIIIVSLIIIIALCCVIRVYAGLDYNYTKLVKKSFEDYYDTTINIGKTIGYYDLSEWGNKKVQCVEGNISTAGGSTSGTATVMSDAKIEGKKLTTKYKGASKAYKDSNSAAAARLAYMAWCVETGRTGHATMSYLIDKHQTELESVIKLKINGNASNNGYYDSDWNEAKKYANNLSADGADITNTSGVKKLEYNSDKDGFGAITATYPSNSKLYIALDGKKYKEYDGKVILSDGSKVNFSKCSGKAFYIPFDKVSSASDLSKVKIKIECNTKVIKARVITCFQAKISTSGGQNQAIMRGKQAQVTDTEEWTISAVANVEVSKKVSQNSKTNDWANRVTIKNGAYVDRGDYVSYVITVKNNGAAVTLDLTDTFDSKQYTVIDAGGLTKSDGKLTLDDVSIGKKKTKTYTVVLQVNSNVTANANTELTNRVKISDFKINSKTVPNTSGKEESSAYVKCKQYRISIDKSVSGISNSTSTVDSVEVGDRVTYNIVVKNNNGSSSNTYGTLNYNISETVPTGLSVPQGGTTNLTNSSGTYIGSGTITSGNSKTHTIKMDVTNALLKQNSTSITNYAEITSVTNRNGIDVKPYLLNDESEMKDSAKIKVLGYNLSISKYITKQNGVAVTDLALCEIGDVLEYTIDVKNTGTSGNHGNIYKINLKDTFKTNELQFVSVTGTGWEQVNGSTTEYIYNGPLAPGKTATLKLTLKVILESKQKIKITNTATITSALNKNNVTLTHIVPTESSATVEYQTYDMDVFKYISAKNSQAITDRSSKTNNEKYDNPIEVEQRDTVEYTIIVKNSGMTKMNNVTFVDTLENGITYNSTLSMKKYNSSGAEDGTSSTISETINGNTITYTYPGELNGGEYFEVVLKCEITKTNMYLLNLKNEVNITKIHNRNNVDLIARDIINYTHKENQDYVRLKDLLVRGSVWIDSNKDGKKDDSEGNLEGIEVILHDATNNKIATTYTDAQGVYTFAETNGEGADSKQKMVLGGENAGRIVKGTDRNDATGNYTTNSKHINYYLEFRYNGAKYQSTVYAGNDGMVNIDTTNYAINTAYLSDSNAYEYSDDRENFDKSLETIEYNTAIEGVTENADGSNLTELSYAKKEHTSTMSSSDGSTMSAYSFIEKDATHNGKLENNKNINMLFLSQTGETEYLKYINLGLVIRDFDLNIDQDVYNLKTTINGREMTYFFNQGSEEPYGGEYVTGGINKETNYRFEVYASDLYYKSTQYEHDDVKEYKKNTELNTEITYKMTVKNNDVNDENNVYTIIREIADFYSSDFIKYDPANNTKVIKVTGADGYLEEKTINKVEAWYEYTNKNGVKSSGTVVLSNSPIYPEHAKVNVGTGNYGIQKYNVLYLSGFDNIKLTQGESFDVYIKFVVDTEDGTSATNLKMGDKNNIVEINAYSTYYEENNKPAGFVDKDSNPGNLGLGTDSSKEIGLEDAAIEDYVEYEDDTYKTGITLISEGDGIPTPPSDVDEKETLDRVINGVVWDDARSTSTGEDGNTQYLGNGIMNIGGDNKIAEAASNEKKDGNRLLIDESTDTYAEGVRVDLIEVVTVPKNGEDRIYEERPITWNGAETSVRTNANGEYKIESFIPGDYIIRFNYGESVEDVVYNGQEYKSTTYYNIENQVTDQPESGDNVLAKLEEEGRSDARDDEIRRLEVIAYSEVVNNRKTEEAQKSLPEEYSESFMENTNMFAETETFPIRPEKTTYDVYEYSFDEYTRIINTDIRYGVENIDFGLEYRPEVNVSIEEFLSEIKLTTSDGNILADIKFDNVYEIVDGIKTDKITGTVINKESSIGAENLQYLPTIDDVKGLAYLNVDTDILQGCTVDITYVFCVNNESEVDRISNNLYKLKYKADAVLLGNYANYCDDVYTAAGTARNELYDTFFDTNGATYRVKDKTSANYYGKYLGNAYYTGVAGANDVVAELKVDKILDYVDNNMVMEADKNVAENQYWTTMTDQELLEQGLINENVFTTVEETTKVNGQVTVQQFKKLMDVNGIIYNTDTRNNLAVSVDDKISTGDNENTNKSLSRFLTPEVSDNTESSGSIYMTASKVVSAESDTNDMRYDNSSEIIQYTSVTGRITGLATTVGNLDIGNDPTYEPPDQEETPTVTLTPPTGLEKAKYYASLAKDQLIMTAIIIAIIIVAIVLKKSLKNVTFKKFYK